MNRARLGSLLALLWSAIQAWSLWRLGFYPPRHLVGWAFCAVFLAISLGLWQRQPWGRFAFLTLGSVLVISYAIIYFFGQSPCTPNFSGCYPVLIVSQPLLTIVGLAILMKPLASNNRWRGP
jgi:hypothetical protein